MVSLISIQHWSSPGLEDCDELDFFSTNILNMLPKFLTVIMGFLVVRFVKGE